MSHISNDMTLPLVLGPTAGPLLGGVLTTYASWRWVFYLNVPIGLFGMALAWHYVAEEQPPAAASPRFDLLGFVMCGLGFASLQLARDDVGHLLLPPPSRSVLFVLSAVLLSFYYLHARRTAEAVLDLSLFAIRTFRITAALPWPVSLKQIRQECARRPAYPSDGRPTGSLLLTCLTRFIRLTTGKPETARMSR